MELNELKKAWQKASPDTIQGKDLDVTKINKMLHGRGKGILSRLDRSVKIGIWFLVVFFLLTLADLLLPAELIFPDKMEASLKVPGWINLLEWCVNLTLMFAIALFIVRYRRLKVQTLADQDLKGAITKVLKLMDTFRKEFYIAVFFLTAGIGLGFLSGAQKGFQTIRITQTPTTASIIVAGVLMLILLGLLVGSIFFIFHKGYKHLFGKYRDQLIQSLNELQENEE